ncbi:methyltransferase domain-containing protein [Streptomyces hoynatensis]|uniref:Methyltransferase domain-containing protein n=1 Tax=Streptomyces hoynatensis TaxID=1141874 RepID=A0A3A9ZBR1_9ACTN|nr:methyltransferase domain-containing protein [Streptomyces hoynatensis]RKN45882.1 methyltransferase domain-containing protein [Streptomyces hoynatensis]
MPDAWNPLRHLRAATARTRPFHDLFLHVPDPARGPARVVDLGCGSGEITALLAERWPGAHVTGLDNSAERLREAERFAGPTPGGGRLDFGRADLADWAPGEPVDVLVSSAAIQWVPDHLDLFKTWTHTLTPGGVLAFQLPDNAASAGHAALRELCASPRWRDRLGRGVLRELRVHDPAVYADRLASLGFAVDAWETTYAHVLPGPDPFAEWIGGTGMRPVLDALVGEPGAAGEFLAAYRERLRAAYPVTACGTVFPFRRVFAVATRGGDR